MNEERLMTTEEFEARERYLLIERKEREERNAKYFDGAGKVAMAILVTGFALFVVFLFTKAFIYGL